MGRSQSIKDLGWGAMEFKNINFGDRRINKRLIEVTHSLSERPQDSINRASQDWASAKAAYRFFDNEKVESEQIISAHRNRTIERIGNLPVVLAVQDTSFLTYNGLEIEGLGSNAGKSELGNDGKGFIVHTVLAIDPSAHVQGVPLGILDQKIWTRMRKLQDVDRSNKQRIKESSKWADGMMKTRGIDSTKVVHVADREADVVDFMWKTHEEGQYFLIRGKNERVLEDNDGLKVTHLWKQLGQQPSLFEYEVDISQDERRVIVYDKLKKTNTRRMTSIPERKALVEVRMAEIQLKTKENQSLKVWAIYIKEKNPPNELVGLEWKLLTNYPTKTTEEIRARISWYKMRWHIENFHKMLKSGCRTEECRMGTADRLKRYITLNSVIAWRLYWLSRVGRVEQETSCKEILAEHEWQALYMKVKKKKPPKVAPSLSEAMRWIAMLGGFLGRKNDGYPGVKAIWIGWQRLTDCADSWLTFKTLNNCG